MLIIKKTIDLGTFEYNKKAITPFYLIHYPKNTLYSDS